MKEGITDTQEVQRLRWKECGGFGKLKNKLEDMRKWLCKCFPVYVELAQFSKSSGFFPSVQYEVGVVAALFSILRVQVST